MPGDGKLFLYKKVRSRTTGQSEKYDNEEKIMLKSHADGGLEQKDRLGYLGTMDSESIFRPVMCITFCFFGSHNFFEQDFMTTCFSSASKTMMDMAGVPPAQDCGEHSLSLVASC